MSASNLRMLRPDRDGAPAALVATWLLDRLCDVGGIDVRVIDVNTIEVDLPEGPASDDIAIPVAEVLTDPRFTGWSLGHPGSEPRPGAAPAGPSRNEAP